jgi:uncharacterized protein YuzE
MTPTIERIVGRCASMARDMIQVSAKSMWIDYDEEADVLYISFRRPQRATKTIEMNDDILVRKAGRAVVGVTVMNASQHR